MFEIAYELKDEVEKKKNRYINIEELERELDKLQVDSSLGNRKNK